MKALTEEERLAFELAEAAWKRRKAERLAEYDRALRVATERRRERLRLLAERKPPQ